MNHTTQTADRTTRLDEWNALDEARREATRGTASQTYAAGDVAMQLLAYVVDCIPDARWRMAVRMTEESIERSKARREARA